MNKTQKKKSCIRGIRVIIRELMINRWRKDHPAGGIVVPVGEIVI